MERTGGITFISIILGLGALNIFDDMSYIYEATDISDISFFSIKLLISILAGVTSIGLWKMKRWSFYIFISSLCIFALLSTYSQIAETLIPWNLFLCY